MKARNLGPLLMKTMDAETEVVIEVEGKTYSPSKVTKKGNLRVIEVVPAVINVEVEDKTPIIESSGVEEGKLADLVSGGNEPTDEADGIDEIENTKADAPAMEDEQAGDNPN